MSASVAVTGSDDSTARVWPLNGSSARSLTTLKHPAWVCSVSLNHNDELCATGCGDSNVRLWSLDAATGYTCLRTIKHCEGSSNTYPMRVRWVDHGDGGASLISTGLDDAVKLWSLHGDGKDDCVATLPHGENLRGLAVADGGLFLASSGGSKSKSVVVWRPAQRSSPAFWRPPGTAA